MTMHAKMRNKTTIAGNYYQKFIECAFLITIKYHCLLKLLRKSLVVIVIIHLMILIIE